MGSGATTRRRGRTVALEGDRAPRGRGTRGAAWISLASVIVGAALLAPCGASRVDDAGSSGSVMPRPPELDDLARIEGLRKQGELDEAARRAEPFRDHRDARVRAAAEGIVARVQLKRGRSEEAIEGLAKAADLHREAGEAEDAARDFKALAYTLMVRERRFSEARAALAQAEALLPSESIALGGVRYYQALLAYQTADLRSALSLCREALKGSKASAQADYRAGAVELLALVLQLLGRDAEATALLEEEESAATDDCTRADVLANLGWIQLRSPRDPSGAAKRFEDSLALRKGRCADAHGRAAVLTDYALLHLREGRDARAREALEEAGRAAGAPDAGLRTVWLDAEGQLSLRAGRPAESLDRFDLLAALAEGVASPVAAWRAALGRARALDALGRASEAGEAYERAESVLARSSLLVPADEGRAGFLGSFDESARAAVGFFLKRDPARAAAVARRARARAMASLRWTERVALLRDGERARWDAAMAAYRKGRADLEAQARDYWTLPAKDLAKAIAAQREAQARLTEQLDEQIASLFAGTLAGASEPSAPSPGELILVIHPTEHGLAVFAVTSEGTRGREVPEVDPAAPPEALSSALLQPFRAEIDRAERVRFIVSGPLDTVDFHALPWENGPLIEIVPVVYGVDAGAASAPSPSRQALIIADPRGDLAAAREEAKVVSSALGAAGFEARSLLGEAATYSAAREAIERAPLGLLHYAGHGSFGGAQGWESGLHLAEGTELSVGDILSLQSAPAIVVLSGCETGRTPSGKASTGLGIAHAFLVVGARAVVAAPRPVDDALAARIVGALYADAGSVDALGGKLAARLRTAELSARSEAPGADWPNFRLLVP